MEGNEETGVKTIFTNGYVCQWNGTHIKYALREVATLKE